MDIYSYLGVTSPFSQNARAKSLPWIYSLIFPSPQSLPGWLGESGTGHVLCLGTDLRPKETHAFSILALQGSWTCGQVELPLNKDESQGILLSWRSNVSPVQRQQAIWDAISKPKFTSMVSLALILWPRMETNDSWVNLPETRMSPLSLFVHFSSQPWLPIYQLWKHLLA